MRIQENGTVKIRMGCRGCKKNAKPSDRQCTNASKFVATILVGMEIRILMVQEGSVLNLFCTAVLETCITYTFTYLHISCQASYSLEVCGRAV